MKLLKVLFIFILFVFIGIVIGMGVQWNTNVSTWSEEARGLVFIFSTFATFLYKLAEHELN